MSLQPPPKLRRIGLFGGAFDPPHLTHGVLIASAMDQFQLDELRVIPTGQAWHKPRVLSSAAQRLAMAQLAFGDMDKVLIDPRETQREGPSYTSDTLAQLQAEYEQAFPSGFEFYLIIGGDQAKALPTWKRWQDVLQYAIVCVAERQDSAGTRGQFVPPNGFKERFLTLKTPLSEVSATQIRHQVALGADTVPLVGKAVARYIAENHLYAH